MQDGIHGFDSRSYNSSLSKYQQLYGKLTAAEKAFVRQHPIASYKILQAGEKAWSFAQGSGLPGFADNGPADAARHAAWGAYSSRRVGDRLALDYLTRHEMFSGNPPGQFQMDMFNNRVGVALGVDQSKTSSTVEDLVMEAYKNNQLQNGLTK